MYTNYGKIYNYCSGSDVIIDSQKFVEPNFQTYLKVGNVCSGENCQDFENDLFVYGRKENISGYRFNPLYERDSDGTKQQTYLKVLKYDETSDTGGIKLKSNCKSCQMKDMSIEPFKHLNNHINKYIKESYKNS